MNPSLTDALERLHNAQETIDTLRSRVTTLENECSNSQHERNELSDELRVTRLRAESAEGLHRMARAELDKLREGVRPLVDLLNAVLGPVKCLEDKHVVHAWVGREVYELANKARDAVNELGVSDYVPRSELQQESAKHLHTIHALAAAQEELHEIKESTVPRAELNELRKGAKGLVEALEKISGFGRSPRGTPDLTFDELSGYVNETVDEALTTARALGLTEEGKL